MMNGDYSWGAGWWIFGGLFMVFCMLMMGRMMMGHGMDHSHTGASSGYGRDLPEDTLASRLASGEIDVEEYEQRLAVLQRSREVHAAAGEASSAIKGERSK